MKILHLIYTSGISGAEKYLKHLLPGLKNQGIDCSLIIVCSRDTYPVLSKIRDEFNEVGVETSLLIYPKLSFISAAKEINKYCIKKDIKIIHSHLSNSDLIAVLVKKLFNKKITLISTKHGYQEKVLQEYEPGNLIPNKNLYYYVTKYLQKNIDKNFAVSKALANLYYDFGLTEKEFPVIHHGVTIPGFDKQEFEQKCRKAEQQLIIVGRIEQFKGHRFLMEAMVEVIKLFPFCKLLVVGEGSSRKQLETQIDFLKIKKNVEFLGFQPHPYSYISNSDVIILPSLFEPFGLVYIEAFALKIPVVAFDTAAGNEIMENNITALMVPKGNSKLLARQIIYLLQNKEESTRITSNAYEVYKDKFTTSTMIENTARWYKNNLPMDN